VSQDAPWSGVVPAAEIAAYGAESSAYGRAPLVGRQVGLLIVDMTHAFLDEEYVTFVGGDGPAATAACVGLVAAARDHGTPVYFTTGFHSGLPPALRGRWRSGIETEGKLPLADANRVVDCLSPRGDELVIDKAGRPSGFFGTPLVSVLVHDGVDTVVIGGVSTSGCVRATAVDAFQYGFRVVVVAEATADRSRTSHAVSLFDLHCRYADVTPAAAAEKILGGVRC
jgi:maleamate amidohydrolase